MAETRKAEFSFVDFKAVKFGFDLSQSSEEGLAIRINPSGKFSSSKSEFKLAFDFMAFHDTLGPERPKITAYIESTFKFSEGSALEDIPEYFYRNAIAIAFPYLRSLVSTLTLQGNSGLLILPVLNLINLEGELRENTSAEE